MSNHPDTLVAYVKHWGKVAENVASAKMTGIDTKVGSPCAAARYENLIRDTNPGHDVDLHGEDWGRREGSARAIRPAALRIRRSETPVD